MKYKTTLRLDQKHDFVNDILITKTFDNFPSGEDIIKLFLVFASDVVVTKASLEYEFWKQKLDNLLDITVDTFYLELKIAAGFLSRQNNTNIWRIRAEILRLTEDKDAFENLLTHENQVIRALAKKNGC